MDIQEVRRQRLKAWFADKPLPAKEKSYLSQLRLGKIPFGEKAARRIEKSYGMGYGYLDMQTENKNTKIVDEFAWVYEHCSKDGKVFLENAVKVAEEAFVDHTKAKQKQ